MIESIFSRGGRNMRVVNALFKIALCLLVFLALAQAQTPPKPQDAQYQNVQPAGNLSVATGTFAGNVTAGSLTSSGPITTPNLITQGTPVYDVRAYGAVSGASDVTTDVQNTVNAAKATGGIVYFPPGVWNINGPINSNCDAIICLPSIRSSGPSVSVKITGSTRIRQDAQGTASALGTLITSTTVGTDRNSAIFGVPQVSSGFGTLDNLDLYVSDITFRTYPNPQIGCVYAFYAQGADITHVRCETGENYTGTHTQPTNISNAIQLPQANNDTLSNLEWSQVSGYYVGVVASEHAHFQGVWIAFGIQGLYTKAGYYPMTGKIGMEEVQQPVVINDSIPMDITLGIEIDPNNVFGCASWCYSSTDIYDSGNALKGSIRYTKVVAGTGNVTTPLVDSGSSNLLNLYLFNQYTGTASYNAAPRTRFSIGTLNTEDSNDIFDGGSTQYGNTDIVTGSWGNPGAVLNQQNAGTLQTYTGGTATAMGTTPYTTMINPAGGQTIIGNTRSSTICATSGSAPCQAEVINSNLPSSVYSFQLVSLSITATGSTCPTTATQFSTCILPFTLPVQSRSTYSVFCSLENSNTAATVTGPFSITVTGFSVGLINLTSGTALSSGTVACLTKVNN